MLELSVLLGSQDFECAPLSADLHRALTCAEQIRSLTRTKCIVTSVKKTLAVIASRSAAVFDQFKYRFIL